ncbi:MAG TPA: Asp-tRNA(Asn)/Glu-tRNA(Gln) amidotransferase subunit GatC [Terriglobales bacterium]|nr:Asp-tRNA(Asn)/Glu-tRNA(Gln) amidotransferase subunit GatC [Terriglobales bacterium]
MNIAAVAALAHLDLNPDELARLERELPAILEYVAQLNQIDTTGVEPMSQPLLAGAPLREDEVRPGFSQADALANAPRKDEGMFQVPAVVSRAGAGR